MSRIILALVVFVVLFAHAGAVQADQITYTIQNYPADQNGASLSGTITTDGATGSLVAADILSWSFTITPSGGTASTYTSSDFGAEVSIIGAVSASPSQITLAEGTSAEQPNSFDLLRSDAGFSLLYLRQGPGGDLYGGYTLTGEVWATESPIMGNNDPWIIAEAASVPEPSSLALAGLGVVCGIAYGLAQKTNSRRVNAPLMNRG